MSGSTINAAKDGSSDCEQGRRLRQVFFAALLPADRTSEMKRPEPDENSSTASLPAPDPSAES